MAAADKPKEEKVKDEAPTAQVKQAAIGASSRIKVTGFKGAFMGAKFDDEGVCEDISSETLAQLKADFPQAEIAELK